MLVLWLSGCTADWRQAEISLPLLLSGGRRASCTRRLKTQAEDCVCVCVCALVPLRIGKTQHHPADVRNLPSQVRHNDTPMISDL